MFRQTKTDAVRANVVSGTELAAALARDRKFRKHLIDALGHGELARRRAARQVTMTAMLARLAADEELRSELVTATRNLQRAWSRVERKRSNRLRNALLVLGGAAAIATDRPTADDDREPRGHGRCHGRADAVSAYLKTRSVRGDRVITVGAGESHPVASNDTPEGRQLNRRVELTPVPLTAKS